MSEITHTSVLGAGVIGASWTALFLASGRSVAVYDPDPEAETKVRAYVENAWPDLTKLGLTKRGSPDAVTFFTDPAKAVENAGFIQENAPERLPIKTALYKDIEQAMGDGAILSSSTSGFMLSQLQSGWQDPSRIILGHPFNPPHLVPLVEIMANEKSRAGLIEEAEAFYDDVGKVTIRVQKEIPGHIANRLQAALWREAIHLVREGVGSVGDVDKAISAGPGLRWAIMGPTSLFHLAAGAGGIAAYCDHFADNFHGWWDELGDVRLDEETVKALATGVSEATDGKSVAELSAERDALLLAFLAAKTDASGPS